MLETLQDIEVGYQFGATGIGLVRTEHMFFGPERLVEMRRFILADSQVSRISDSIKYVITNVKTLSIS